MVAPEEALLWTALVSALGTAAAFLWKKVLKPGSRLLYLTQEMLPLLRDLNETFRETPHAFEVLDEIVQQVRTDSGSSLLDVIHRLEKASIKAAELADELKVGVEANRLLAIEDRLRIDRLLTEMGGITALVKADSATGQRIEEEGERVAEGLQAAQQRASEADGPEGAAADAAAIPDQRGGDDE